MRIQIVSAAVLTAALAPTHTPEFTTNLSTVAAYPELSNTTEQLPPVSATASNIMASERHPDITPPLPMPSAGPPRRHTAALPTNCKQGFVAE